MSRFAYARDPLCLAACAIYVVNRVWLRAHVGGPFLTGQCNDLLLIPAALPLVLWIQRRLGLRPDDRPPAWREIGVHLAAWTLAAEVVMPQFTARATADWRDAIAYGAGALVSGVWWHATGVA